MNCDYVRPVSRHIPVVSTLRLEKDMGLLSFAGQ
jgi:hypothetical protein